MEAWLLDVFICVENGLIEEYTTLVLAIGRSLYTSHILDAYFPHLLAAAEIKRDAVYLLHLSTTSHDITNSKPHSTAKKAISST